MSRLGFTSKVLLFLGLVLFPCANGADSKLFNALPSAEIFPSPVGILFPAFQNAAGVNPAAIPLAAHATALELAYMPALQTGRPQQAFASIASSNGTSGIGAGVTGFLNPDQHVGGGEFIGGGVKIDRVSLGLSLRNQDVSQGYRPDVDIGMLLRSRSGPSLGFVLYHVNNSGQLDFGLGYSEEHSYNVEIDFLLPNFDSFSASTINYSMIFSATVYTGKFGFSLRTVASATENNATLSALLNLTQDFNLTVQWTNPNSLTLAATLLI